MEVLLRTAICAALVSTVAAAGGFAGGAAIAAEAFPQKPIRIIVPFPPGGGTDLVTRIIAPPLSEGLGQSVIVDNRGGAQGVTGTQMGAKAAPDGYTLTVAEIGAIAVAPPMIAGRPPFDATKDFAPVGMLITQPYVMSIHPSVPANDLAEFIKLVQANPGKFNFGSGNATAHVAQEAFFSTARLRLTHVPYRGSGPSMAALLGNEVQVIFSGPGAALPQIRAGKIRALAVTTAKRAGELPDVPALSEIGFKGFEISGWYGLVAPAGTPRPVITRLNTELNKVLSGGKAAQLLSSRGYEPTPMSPDEFGKYLRSEVLRWAKAIKEYGVKSTD